MTNARGIDTSHFNGDISHVVNDVDFVISQCTVGTYGDSHYRRDHTIARAAGKLAAAYHYGVFGPGPTRQAQHFLDNAGDADWLMVDAEARGSGGLLRHPDTITAIIVNIRRLDPHKRKITLYASRDAKVLVKGVDVPIWSAVTAQDANHVACYGCPDPGHHWRFWQTDNHGIDHDVYNGSVEQLKAWVAHA